MVSDLVSFFVSVCFSQISRVFPFKKKAKWVKWRKGKRVLVIYVGYRCPADISSLP